MAADQRRLLHKADPQTTGDPDLVDVKDLPDIVSGRPRGSGVLVNSIANLGPDPAAILAVLDAAETAGVTLIAASPTPTPLNRTADTAKAYIAATALLRATLAHSAAALDRAVAAATPELPEQVGRGRPRALDDDAVREIATAGAGTSAADLAADLGVSARTIRRYRARLRKSEHQRQ